MAEPDSSLWDLLERHLPLHLNDRTGRLAVRKIAKDMDMTYQGVYRWFSVQNGKGAIHPRNVKPLLELPGSTLTQDMLLPFVFNS